MELNEKQIRHMVDRFLGWHLPRDFSPDDGIRYTPTPHHERNMPTGTNLFTATQADEMVRNMVEGLYLTPLPAPDADVVERVKSALYKVYGKPDGSIDELAQAAIAALPSSGYVRATPPAPQPDVNQMMLEALMDALEPWANMKGTMSDFWDDNRSITSLSGFDWSKIKVGDLRRAAAALKLYKEARDE